MYPAHISKARGVGTFCAFDAKNRDQMITKLKEKGNVWYYYSSGVFMAMLQALILVLVAWNQLD